MEAHGAHQRSNTCLSTANIAATLEKSILWIFQDLLVIRPNQNAREMMRRIEILVEHCRGSIFQSTQGQERLAEDWEQMP